MSANSRSGQCNSAQAAPRLGCTIWQYPLAAPAQPKRRRQGRQQRKRVASCGRLWRGRQGSANSPGSSWRAKGRLQPEKLDNLNRKILRLVKCAARSRESH